MHRAQLHDRLGSDHAEGRLDSKYLIATSDPHISSEDAALATRASWKPDAASAT